MKLLKSAVNYLNALVKFFLILFGIVICTFSIVFHSFNRVFNNKKLITKDFTKKFKTYSKIDVENWYTNCIEKWQSI